MKHDRTFAFFRAALRPRVQDSAFGAEAGSLRILSDDVPAPCAVMPDFRPEVARANLYAAHQQSFNQ